MDELKKIAEESRSEFGQDTPNVETPKEDTTPVVETKEETSVKKSENLESIAELAEKSHDSVPLAKYMQEKNEAKRLKEEMAILEAKLASKEIVKQNVAGIDVKSISEKYDVDESLIADIISATKEVVRKDVTGEFAPKFEELEASKKKEQVNEFNQKFDSLLEQTISEMPEYSNLIDKDDIKTWVLSGKYSKLSMAELIEQKYSKGVQGKKTLESNSLGRVEQTPNKVVNLTADEYKNLEKDPNLKKQWSESLIDRMRGSM